MHFHDLRHTGNSLTANAGANLQELMTRMGHTSPRAALIYLHSTDQRQRDIAEALGRLVRADLAKARKGSSRPTVRRSSGTQRARRTGGR
jgi:integrase